MKTKLWCCTGTNFKLGHYFDWQSLSYSRSGSIKKFISDSDKNWRWYKRRGWKCIKVEMKITAINNA